MDEFHRGIVCEQSNRSTEKQPTSSCERSAFPTNRVCKRALVIEDDEPLAKLVTTELAAREFIVDTAHDGEAGLALLNDGAGYDLLVLDLHLPKLDGIGVLRNVKSRYPGVRTLVLTAVSGTDSKVKVLQGGADDYLTKPFSLLEFLARVDALMRRTSKADTAVPVVSKVADLILYREQRRVERNGRRIDLTPREFGILEFLMRNAGRPVTRATLLQEVWNMAPDPSTNIVDVYMKYVRDKVDAPGEVKLTHTIRGVGYELREP